MPSNALAVLSERPREPDGPDSQSKQAMEPVERLKEFTKEQKAILDMLGKACIIVNSIQAVLGTMDEVSQSHVVDTTYTYGIISCILP